MPRRSFVLKLVLGCSALILAAPRGAAQAWNQFRGPHLNGMANDVALPTEWAADQNILWKRAVPGLGWSQPIVWGDRIFLTAAETDEQAKPDPRNSGPGFNGLAGFFSAGALKPPQATYRWKVYCLDAATGDVVWERVAREGRPTSQIHPNNTYATETPVTDGKRLICYFGMIGVYAFDMAGEPLWSKDLGAYPTQFGWGSGSSPVIHDDLVYIQCDNDRESFLVALDAENGEERWRMPRDEKSNWSTPFLWKNKARTELVAAGGDEMRSYDPATGKLLWNMRGRGRTSVTPVGNDELLIVDSGDRLTGMNGELSAVRAGGDGDLSLEPGQTTSDHVAWSVALHGNRIASPLLYENCLYLLDNRGGIVHCRDASTGAENYRKRLPGASGFTASPIASAGRVYLIDENCLTSVVEAGPDYKVIASNKIGEMSWSSPAVAGDRLLLRTVDHVYCIGQNSR